MAWLLPIMPVLGLIAMAMSLSHLLPIAISLALRRRHGGHVRGVDGAQPRCSASSLWLATPAPPRARAAAARRHPLHRAGVGRRRALRLRCRCCFGIGLSFTDAYFESMSALTATGATLLSRARPPAAVAQRLARRAAMARRHGRHRAGGRGAADDRRGRPPDHARPRSRAR